MVSMVGDRRVAPATRRDEAHMGAALPKLTAAQLKKALHDLSRRHGSSYARQSTLSSAVDRYVSAVQQSATPGRAGASLRSRAQGRRRHDRVGSARLKRAQSLAVPPPVSSIEA